MIKKWKRKGKETVKTQIIEDNKNKNKTEFPQNRRIIQNFAKSVHFMTRKHKAARNNYEELARFAAEDLEESELKYHLETMKKNAINLTVATFDELQLAHSSRHSHGTVFG